MRTGAANNRDEGAIFEGLFRDRARSNGFVVLKNHLTARYGYAGKLILVKSELDFKVIRREDGRVGYFDCKSFAGSSFSYSEIQAHQIDRSKLYNQCRVPSGFVVWFRKINRVVFYTGMEIALKGPRSSFGPDDGHLLGRFENFDLKRILAI